ncbi:MAG: DUF2764 family protein [Bacteroidales bacterium]|nr:DUF2764 family protein [Bacteroidales bacterium]
MNNYEYIIASLPVLARGDGSKPDAAALLEEIRSQLSEKDCGTLDFLLDGFDSEKLGAEYYAKAAASPHRFIREYFAFDLGLRNTKVRWLNRTLGRAPEQDILVLGEEPGDFPLEAEANAVLEGGDILEREKGLDALMWNKADEICLMDVFTLDLILSFVAKLQIVDRWLRLDEETGRALFRRLLAEIKETKTKDRI